MNALIVDDDRFVVAALKKGIHWDALGFTEVFTAYNMEQARTVISDNGIDLLISDIDMPHGSGLDLLAWVRAKHHEMPCIFLTNYADFSYAQEAIHLKCFHYFLKPVDYERLTVIIQKAVAEVSERHFQIEEQYLSFWRDVMFQKAIREGIEIPYEATDHLTPVLFQLYPYYLSSDLKLQNHLSQDAVSLMRPILESLVPALSEDGSILTTGIPGSDQCLMILKEEAPQAEALRIALEEFVHSFADRTHCPINAYMGRALSIDQIVGEVGRMREWMRDDLGTSLHVMIGPPVSYEAPDGSVIPDTDKIAALLAEERFDLLADYCHDYLTHLEYAGLLHARSMGSFQIDVVQQLYAHLGKRGILANRLFYGEPYRTIASCASRRAQDLEMYFHYIFSIAEHNLSSMTSEKGVAEIIREYVDAHYADDIGRDSLENILYFDPDYASRLFKKETGMSFMNYVIQRRLLESKRLLRTTEYPISKVAALVGYDNYSYFTRLFKKEIGQTPVEYRMQQRSKAT